ncbi:hypothetical protein WICPIJ_008398 [Wickerhamomyces pijperi]|uniref:DUF218 domain-containing protein n=1 Tax=Wickerhamomyces pijperi TaxID=599730 RepID=A0A9P8TIX3_WICPI|nr:hypothetical protein WICPIJ_008398 [Wickerhamomyces pijperi]
MSKHLILLPCHSIYKPPNSPQSPESWFLAPFQIEANDHLTFIQHMEKAFQLLKESAENQQSTLIISGGMTKAEAGEVSEAASYLSCAKILELNRDHVNDNNVLLEEYARDSFENLLFSLCLFQETHRCFPESISIVGFEFKRDRFVNYHAKALKIQDIVQYFGIDPTPEYDPQSSQYQRYFDELKESEWRFSVKLFKDDLLGNGEKLKNKKLTRDPFNRSDGGYSGRHPELHRFFTEVTDTTDDFDVPW